jgi:hypothetical protein
VTSRSYKCINFGNCVRADADFLFEVPESVLEPTCDGAGCGKGLEEVAGEGRKNRGPKKLLLGFGLLLISAAFLYLAYSLAFPDDEAFRITNGDVVVGMVRKPLSFILEASPKADTYETKSLPTGLSLNAVTGEITGTPTSQGEVDVEVTARRKSQTAMKRITFRINDGTPPNRSPPIPPTAPPATAPPATAPPGTPPNIVAGQHFEATLGHRSDFTISGLNVTEFTAEGALPPGFTLSPQGRLSGTPAAVGEFVITVTARVGSGSSVRGTVDLTVVLADDDKREVEEAIGQIAKRLSDAYVREKLRAEWITQSNKEEMVAAADAGINVTLSTVGIDLDVLRRKPPPVRDYALEFLGAMNIGADQKTRFVCFITKTLKENTPAEGLRAVFDTCFRSK